MIRRFGTRAAVFAVLAMISTPGSAVARQNKKHPKHAPATHHEQPLDTQAPAGEETGEGETADRPPPEPADESAPGRRAGGAVQPEETSRDSSSEPTGDGSPRAASRDAADGGGDEAEATATDGPRPPPALRAGIGFGAVYRRLTWIGAHSSALSDYSMSPGPQLGGWLEIFPGALVNRSLGANVGAIVSFNRGFGISSKSAAGDTSTVIFEDFVLGLKMRFPLGFFIPHVSAAYAGQVFLFTPRLAPVPSVFYAFARVAVGARVQIANAIDAEVEAAYLAVVDSGEQSGYVGAPEYLQGLSTYGLEAGGSIGVRVTGVFGLRAGVDFRRYALDPSHATGMLMADKATDQYLTVWGGVEIVLDGASGIGSAAKPRSENRPPAPPALPPSD
ncbi:MAG: hypothetical protein ABUS79_19295 [Pseudomonadota bacterium]